MEKHKILCIAPYKGMNVLLSNIVSLRDDIELTVYVGDLEKGVEIAKKTSLENYDAIISRGGTAEMLRTATDVPIIEVSLSVYDILRAIRLAQHYTEQYAIVGFPSITTNAYLLCDLMQLDITIMTIHRTEEVNDTLKGLKDKGYQMVVGDMITSKFAKQMGMNSILITSGAESIENALDRAVWECRYNHILKAQNRLFQTILKKQKIQTVIFNDNDQPVLSTISPPLNDTLLLTLKKEIPTVLRDRKISFAKRTAAQQLLIDGQRIPFYDSKEYTVFFVSIEPNLSDNGIKYLNRDEAAQMYEQSFFANNAQYDNVQELAEKYNKSSLPILFVGEYGTGKEDLAYMLYAHNTLSNNPLIVIDCNLLEKKHWKYLLSSINSPMNDSAQTFFFKDCNSISERIHNQLIQLLDNTNVSRRNKFIFSFTGREEHDFQNPLYIYLTTQFTCFTLTLQPLRAQMNEFQNILSLYINSLNTVLGKQIIGVEEAAVEILQSFQWPDNHTQLKRVLYELMVLSNGNYITESDTKRVLQCEIPSSFENFESENILDLSGTLEEINKTIVKTVLAQEENNHSRTAERLGISRSTLWRMLK